MVIECLRPTRLVPVRAAIIASCSAMAAAATLSAALPLSPQPQPLHDTIPVARYHPCCTTTASYDDTIPCTTSWVRCVMAWSDVPC